MILSVTLNPCVDRTLFVDKLTPHDSNRVVRTETDAGGKGINAARIIGELGVPVVATGFLAGGNGRYIDSVLDSEAVDADFVFIGGETRLNISIEDGTGKPPTTLNEKGPAVPKKDFEGLMGIVFRHLCACKYVTAGGSLPPGAPAEMYANLVEFTREHDVPMAVDADGDALRLALEARPFLVKPNADETERLLGEEPRTLEEGLTAAKKICELGASVTIVSMGGMGAALAAEGVGLIVEAPKVKATSTIGAGDSMVGGFLASLYKGHSIEEALRWGAAAGAATAMTDGSEIGRRTVIEEMLPKVIIRRA